MKKIVKLLILLSVLTAFSCKQNGDDSVSNEPIYLDKQLKEYNNCYGNIKWYQYRYLQGKDTIYAAFDLDGNRITPNSDFVYEEGHHGSVPFVSGGIFIWESKDTCINGRHIIAAYNIHGDEIVPVSMGVFSISRSPDGIMVLTKRDDADNKFEAAYDSEGRKIIPFSAGHKSINYYDDKAPKYFWCDDRDGSEYTYSENGQFYATGWLDLTNSEKKSVFEATKHKSPWYKQNDVENNNQEKKKIEPDSKPMQTWTPCPMCNNSGKCTTCDGQGWRWVSNGNPHAQCINCGGSGRCTMCAGQGGHYEVKYY